MGSLFGLVCVVALSALLALGCGERTGECGNNVCSCTEEGIRAAIEAGEGPYTFNCDGGTTVVTEAEIVIDNDVILDGEGNLTVDGNLDHRVFSVPVNVTVELIGFTVTNGSQADDHGGGIWNAGTLTVIDSTMSESSAGGDRDCRADSFDVPCYEGGGLWNAGTLTIMNSTVSGNSAPFGGGIASRLGTLTVIDSTVSGNSAQGCRAGVGTLCSGGGGIWNAGTLMMMNSTVSGSTSDLGAGIYNRGAHTLTDSTVSENTAGFDGGGIINFGTLTVTNSTVSGNDAGQGGGGISNAANMLTVTNSTVSGNTAVFGGGGIINRANAEAEITRSTLSENTAETGGGIFNAGDLVLANSTVSGNTADTGGGIYKDSLVASTPRMTVTNSTVAGNTADTASGIYDEAPPDSPLTLINNTLIEGDCADTPLESNGYNIESPEDTCGFVQEGDQAAVTEVQLNLGPLQDNGGPTETQELGENSVAIDWIPAAECVDGDGEPLTTDQRGEPRPVGAGSMCDVGAFEAQP